jgi:predicted DsbA family dithiol-disulfide isomerase
VNRVQLAYWSDPLCIWAFVAQDKLNRVRAQFGDDIQLNLHIVPVFGSIPHRFREGSWKAPGVEGRIASMQRIALEHTGQEITCQVWRDDPPASSWTPGAAFKAVQLMVAADKAPEGCELAYLERMREWFFLENRNIARRDVQLALAESLGIPRAPLEACRDNGQAFAALWEDHQERERLKLRGSPTWLLAEDRAELFGNFPYELLEASIKALLAGVDPGGSRC